MTVWVLGDQLTREVGPLARTENERVLMIEAREFARKLPSHPHKLVTVFAAMRHFRDELRADNYTVDYHTVETFGDGLDAHFSNYPEDDLESMRPASHGAGERLAALVADRGGDLTLHENELFLCNPAEFDEWADGDELRQEDFYREMRRETGYLMDGDEPVGGEWNYDTENRAFPGADYDPPDAPWFEPDDLTRDVVEWVDEEFSGGYDEPPYGGDWAAPEKFGWPVTREASLTALDSFVEERLANFGPYQDAMLSGEPTMHHALLSVPLNLGLLHPREVIERVLEAYDERDLPLSSVEGFVRQVLGWREFVRHVYRREMPEMAHANQLDAERDLPEFFWTGETEMHCLAEVVDGVRKRGYAHHIERLMVLSNVATSFGVDPAALNRWFHAGYVDAYHWVTTPNVVGMGTFGTDALSTKPYVSSANYVDGMSDFCGDCSYAKTKTTGENACPFNALYWDFLGEHEEMLRENGRMGLVYSHWDDKDDEERAAIRERAAEVRTLVDRGDL